MVISKNLNVTLKLAAFCNISFQVFKNKVKSLQLILLNIFNVSHENRLGIGCASSQNTCYNLARH